MGITKHVKATNECIRALCLQGGFTRCDMTQRNNMKLRVTHRESLIFTRTCQTAKSLNKKTCHHGNPLRWNLICKGVQYRRAQIIFISFICSLCRVSDVCKFPSKFPAERALVIRYWRCGMWMFLFAGFPIIRMQNYFTNSNVNIFLILLKLCTGSWDVASGDKKINQDL